MTGSDGSWLPHGQQSDGGVCEWATAGLRVTGASAVSPIVTYVPRAGAGQGEGTDGAGGGGRGEAAQLRDAAEFGWATWVE